MGNFKWNSLGSCLGGFFLAATLVILPGCKEQSSTPTWPEGQQPLQTQAPEQNPEVKVSETYTFVAYNLKNYLKMWRLKEGRRQMLDKPEDEVQQLVSVISATNPDVLGLCEIGSERDLKSLKKRLAAAGVSLPYTYLTSGSDQQRSLAMLSRFPITANPKPIIAFKMDNQQHYIRRGIADAYVNVPSGRIRFIGVHFKSKNPSPQFSQESIRRNEAYTLRRHIVKIHSNKETASDRVIVYGDFNDTTQSHTVRSVVGSTRQNTHIKPINLKDQYGLNWTYHWDHQDVYSRIDFVMANKFMMPYILTKESYIMDVTKFPEASDHRPLVVRFQ